MVCRRALKRKGSKVLELRVRHTVDRSEKPERDGSVARVAKERKESCILRTTCHL
jgi:hypothetical protein